MSNLPFTRGLNCTLKVYSDGKPHYLPAKNWSIEQNATEVVDDVNGESRSRLDLITNYYTLSLDIYHQDEDLMQALLDQQDNDDATGVPYVQNAGFRIQHRDKTRAAYRLDNCKFGPWTMNVAGRTEANMVSLKIRFTSFKKVPTI